jgi:Asp-tRNA(Asn)/Glu-tRNA(Gln) amidotransferase C subunit
VYDVWREDIPRDGFGAETALSNAPRKAQGQFLITRVVEE